MTFGSDISQYNNKQRSTHEEYSVLAGLWSAGVSEYHSLTSTYLTANNIVVAVIALIFSSKKYDAEIMLEFSDKLEVKFGIELIFCLIGIILCLQMTIAQSRMRFQNNYWARCIRLIEKSIGWKTKKYFSELEKLIETKKTKKPNYLPEIEELGEKALLPSWGIKKHRKWWAPRMKGLPVLYTILYGLLILFSILKSNR